MLIFVTKSNDLWSGLYIGNILLYAVGRCNVLFMVLGQIFTT